MDRHLTETEIEALAHAREDLVSEETLTHLAACDACASHVMVSRALSQSLGVQLREQLASSESSAFAIDDLVTSVLNDEYAAPYAPPVAVPARGTLLSGLFGGVIVALTTGALSGVRLPTRFPSLAAAYEALRIARSVMGAIDGQVVSHLPGGWGLVMVSAWVLLAVLMLPARLLLVRGRTRAPGMLATGLMLLGVLVVAQPARALEIEGELPEQKRVSLSVMREPTSKVLGRVADAAGLGLVITLPEDPLVSVRVKQASLREVLTAVLGEQPVTVRVEGKLLIVRNTANDGQPPLATAAPAAPDATSALPIVTTPEASDADDPANAPNVVVPKLPGLPPVPGLPPRPELRSGLKKRVSDRVVMGGNSTVAADEHVRDAVAVGGNLTVHGVVEGDVLAIGGHIHLMPGSVVKGELVAVGGAITQDPGATVLNRADAKQHHDARRADDEDEEDDDDEDEARIVGPWTDRGAARDGRDDDERNERSWLSQTLACASSYALLFVFGLVLLGVWPRRMDALQRTMTRSPLRTFAIGVLGALGAAVLCVLLLITILGIPAAIVLALSSALATYAGVAAAALAVGKLLPVHRLADRPVLQLGAGVFLLFLLALIPVLGVLVFVVAAALGIGAIVRTRLSETSPTDVVGGGMPSVEPDALVSQEPGQ